MSCFIRAKRSELQQHLCVFRVRQFLAALSNHLLSECLLITFRLWLLVLSFLQSPSYCSSLCTSLLGTMLFTVFEFLVSFYSCLVWMGVVSPLGAAG